MMKSPSSIYIPDTSDARLGRLQLAEALTALGYPTAAGTLATYATRGGGPPYEVYGRRVIYTWGSALGWAKSRTSKIVHSSAELEVA